MLSLVNVTKRYATGELVQTALDAVTLGLRTSEFVAVLGPSGSGKTTLLNVLGGLDRYDEGDLLVNGVSTKGYAERDWDTYRNHDVGFVFQSYNLIPHQTVLANVELALTIAGVGPAERRERATRALEEVGLGDQLAKLPAQLSGGQMQRVAIARALVNDPSIVLADEPTGALDSQTSLQIMELLKQISHNRLVVMVTHNPELAERYATRIVNLRDGRIVGDTNPYDPDQDADEAASAVAAQGPRGNKRSSMAFGTALSLSFANLRTKKGRTLLTAIAGSIGIVGIALILALSHGVNTYIETMQRDTMASYPLVINAQEFDVSSFVDVSPLAGHTVDEETADAAALSADMSALEQAEAFEGSLKTNNLTAFKAYLDDPNSPIRRYLGSNGVVYTYRTSFSVYTYDAQGAVVNTNADVSEIGDPLARLSLSMGLAQGAAALLGTKASAEGAYNFSEIVGGSDGDPVGPLTRGSYEVVQGAWPQAADEAVLVVDAGGSLPLSTLYQLGLVSEQQYLDAVELIEQGQSPAIDLPYAEILGHEFTVVPAALAYLEGPDGVFVSRAGDSAALPELMDQGLPLRIVGVVRPLPDGAGGYIAGAVGYTGLLTQRIVEATDASPVVRAQEADPSINVLTGLPFEGGSDEEKLAAVKESLGMGSLAAAALGMDDATLLALYDEYLGGATYAGNMEAFGKVNYETPASISIYTDSFEDKDGVARCIATYNAAASEADQISYTDLVGLLTGSLTSMVSAVSAVLIAFVGISLVVSCIMIGIITHISVLERIKEIGILRALGASRRNISQVFNAETVIVGLLAGVLGVGAALLLTVPVNAVVDVALDADGFRASLPWAAAVALVVLSVLITMVGGAIPARRAARQDPVVALRSE